MRKKMQLYHIPDELIYRQFKIVDEELASLKVRNGKLLKYLISLEARIKDLEEMKNE